MHDPAGADHFRPEGIADGLNMLAGPNELGKSTLFHALESLIASYPSGK